MTDFQEGLIIAQAKDEWGDLYIVEEGNERSLYFTSDSPQSTMWIDSPFDLTIEYTQLLMASLLFIRKPVSVLLFGLGGGSIAKFLWKTFPHCEIHIVELRPKLVPIAQEYFHLPKSPRIHYHIDDAARFVHKRPFQLFDLIVIDLFTAEGMSPSLTDQDFFEGCERFLDPQGVVSWNVWQSTPMDILERTVLEMSAAFGKNIIYLPSQTEGNLTMIALPKKLEDYKLSQLKSKALNLSNKTHLNFPFLMRTYNNFKQKRN